MTWCHFHLGWGGDTNRVLYIQWRRDGRDDTMETYNGDQQLLLDYPHTLSSKKMGGGSEEITQWWQLFLELFPCILQQSWKWSWLSRLSWNYVPVTVTVAPPLFPLPLPPILPPASPAWELYHHEAREDFRCLILLLICHHPPTLLPPDHLTDLPALKMLLIRKPAHW